MDVNVFYSWQSDLPNNKNRGFIQECIERAVKQMVREQIHLEVAIDRDTKGLSGTPDIASSIFSKIDNATIFIADISIINATSSGKKVSNPNVLIELGYAAKTLGWSHIICLFNTEYGDVEELPFDLRFRRPLTYSINDISDKSTDRARLVHVLKTEIISIISNKEKEDEVNEYIKQQIDKEILTICNQLYKILYGYDTQYTTESISQIIELEANTVKALLSEKKFIGFTVLKDWKKTMQTLQEAMNQPFFSQNAKPSYVSGLIKVIKSIEMMSLTFSKKNLFFDTEEEIDGYRIIDGHAMIPDNPRDSYVLTKDIGDSNKGIVIDFGTIRRFNMGLVRHILVLNEDLIGEVSVSIQCTLKSIDAWIATTGNRLILDPSTFR
jgi:hypothetical protein